MKTMEYIYNPHGIESWDFSVNRKSLGRWIFKYISQRFLKIRTVFLESSPQSKRAKSYVMNNAMYKAAVINGGNQKMVSQAKGMSPTLVKKGDRLSGTSTDTAGYKLHIAMDKKSYAQLVWLKGALQAASIGEVLRRALNAYEIFDPIGLTDGIGDSSDRASSSETKNETKHLYIVISNAMKDHLDNDKIEEGRAYTDTISRALCVLTQLVRERSKLIAKLEAGDVKNDHKDHRGKSQIETALLALI